MRWLGVIVLCAAHTTLAQPCSVSYISIETTTPGLELIKGCYDVSLYSGMSQTLVYTIGGEDVNVGGSPAILAKQTDSGGHNLEWNIAIVTPGPQQTWSDGYTAELEVANLVCVGTGPFWEMDDPTEVETWLCDPDGDGQYTSSGNGDFQRIYCGCPGSDVYYLQTPSPAGTGDVQWTQPPVATVPDAATPAPVPVSSQTLAPVATDTGDPEGTSPSDSSGTIAEEAQSCNMTFVASQHADIEGCYVGRPSSNERGRWQKLDTSAIIEWRDVAAQEQAWIIAMEDGFGGYDVRCISDEDTDNPDDIDPGMWKCRETTEDSFSATGRGEGFEGLTCVQEECTLITAAAADDGVSGSDDSREIILVASCTVGALMLGGLAAFAYVISRRTKAASARKAPAAATSGAASPTTSTTPTVEIPVFQPWGTRGPPRHYS